MDTHLNQERQQSKDDGDSKVMVTSKSTWNETDEERRERICREAELDRINEEREIQRRQLPFKILESLNAINTKLELLLEIAKNDR